MKGCAERFEDLALLLAGEIDPERRADLVAHLEGCPDCARTRAGFEKAFADLRAADAPDPGPVYWSGFETRFRARLAARRAAAWRRSIALAAAAAVVFAAGAGVFLERRSGRPDGVAVGGMAASPRGGGSGRPEVLASRTPGAPDFRWVAASPAAGALREGEGAEARLEAALHAARSRAAAAEEFEAILDEVAPGDPYDVTGVASDDIERGSGV